MGSDVHLIVVGGHEALIDRAERRIHDLEQRWSRFLGTSEISRINAASGQWVTVSADTVLLIERAIEAWRLTGGGFDPTVLEAVVAAGYDRSFDELAADRPATASPPVWHVGLVGPTDIDLDGLAVRLPAGCGFDPGGIGKGLCADLVVTELLGAGAAGACVNMGGDVRVAGIAPGGSTWTIAIEHPHSPEPIAMVGLAAGAVATSTTLRRTWSVGGQRRHHLIDPSTGQPSDSDLDLATVVAGEAWTAEVLAKALVLRGSQRAFDVVDPAVAAGLTVDGGGTVRTTPGFSAYTGGIEVCGMMALDSGVDPLGPDLADIDD